MNEKKNIDKLFKEQLKDFDVAPEDYVWENIEERLHEDKRKKRRVIPIWWRVAGIAAGLLLLFTLANQFFNSSESNNFSKEIIVDETKANNNSNSNAQDEKNRIEESNSLKDVLGNETSEDLVDTNSKTSVENEKPSEDKNRSNTIASDPKSKTTVASDYSNEKNRKEKSQNNSNSEHSNSYNYKEDLQKQNKTPVQNQLTKDAVANTTNANSETNQNSQTTIKNKSEIDALLNPNKSDSKTTVADVNTKDKGTSETESNSTEDAQSTEKEETNAIEDAIAEAENTEEKEEEEKENLNRWSVSPSVAPVYFSSLGKGSPLDNQFVENTKESEINMSYGINGSYTVNKRFKIRAGINKVQLGYQTNDVLIFENTNPVARGRRQIANVNLTDSMSQHSIYSARSFKFENAPATLFTQEQGSIDQQLGFIEVPIEVEYNIIERKIGVNLIGGFSTLFLSDNDVYAVLNNGDRTRLGEATNIKDLSYTANFGIGLDYNFSEQFQFNLEPTFKYQINTFNNASGDFKPFFVGVYTGLSFKF